MRRRAGIQTKLFLLISALAPSITLAFTIGGWRWYQATATNALEQKALTYAQLVGRSVESAIALFREDSIAIATVPCTGPTR